MAWEGSDRRDRLPPNWESLRLEQLKADGHQCVWRLPSGKRCPRRATDVDHIDEKADDHSRLQSLCAHHHGKKTAIAAVRLKKAKAAAKYRPAEEHPGRL